MNKKNRKLLLQMAVRFLLLIGIIAGVLAASVFFVSFAIFHGSQINMIDKVFNGIREQMEENPHMESLIDFWEEHPEDLMSGPDETRPENDEQTVSDTALLDDEDFSQLPFEEQTALAHSEYRKLTEKCGEYIDLFDFEEIFCIDVSDDHFGTVLFCEKKDRENENSVPGTNSYADYIDSKQPEKIISKKRGPRVSYEGWPGFVCDLSDGQYKRKDTVRKFLPV